MPVCGFKRYIVRLVLFCSSKCGFSDAIVDASSDDEWDEEDLRPLLPPGTSLGDYVNSDDHVATQRTFDDNWERALK